MSDQPITASERMVVMCNGMKIKNRARRLYGVVW